MIAETVTGHSEIIVIDGAYHGHSKPLMGLSSYKMKEKDDSGISPNPHAWIASNPDPFRGKYTDPATAGTQYAGEVKEMIDSMEKEGKKLACYVCESFPGCAGQVKLPEGYFKAVFDHVHRAGGLCVIDEVQTGFGRGGEFFWIFQSQGVKPDIVTVGKPMGNGHPIAAVVTTKEIARDFLAKRPDLQNEYKGNLVSLAVAEAVLRVVEEEGLVAHARELGGYILSQLGLLANKHPCIGDVRGYGLFIGVELTEGPGSKAPNGKLAKDVVAKMLLRDKIMVMQDGLDNNVLKIKPPMCFTRANADSLLQSLDAVLTDLTQ
jgi:ethanolamine-phosphate phospho-lyase